MGFVLRLWWIETGRGLALFDFVDIILDIHNVILVFLQNVIRRCQSSMAVGLIAGFVWPTGMAGN